MIKRMIVMLLLVGLVLGSIYSFKKFQGFMIKQYMGTIGKQPQTVSTATATLQVWNGKIQAVGSLRAVRGVDVSSEVAGIIDGVYFESGDKVLQGTLLAKMRTDDEIAALEALKADAYLAQLTYERDLIQLERKAVAQSVVDIDKASLDRARALVVEQEAVIAKKFIRAPFSGRLGIRIIDLGQYISPGTVFVTLQSLDPIYFDFFLPQQDLINIKIGQRVHVTTDLSPDQKFVGKIWAINSKVDPESRNVEVQAVLDNAEELLIPGMYGVIQINLDTQQQYLTIPQTAIMYNPYGNTVYVVKRDGKNEDGSDKVVAQQQFVTLGPTRGDQIAVLKGLQAGDEVVTAGQMKLQNGVVLNINNTVLPSDDPNPKPTEY